MKNTKFKLSKIELTLIQRFFDNIKSIIEIFRKTNLFLKYGNKITISLLVLIFLYLTYLSLPGLLDKQILERGLKNKIYKDFRLRIDTPTKINYSILPSPHFIIRNVTILNENNSKYEGVIIKKFKVKISQKNLFNYKNFIIKDLTLDDVLINTKRSNTNIFIDFFSNKLSQKKIKLNKTKLIYSNHDDETVLIVPLKKIDLNYDQELNFNILSLTGKIFNQPFDLKFKKQISDKKMSEIFFKLKNVNFKFQNQQYLNEKKIIGINNFNFGKKEFYTTYSVENDKLIFSSKKKETKNKNFKYNGGVDLNPFEFNISAKAKRLKTNQITDNYFILRELLRNKIVINRNFNGKISIKINDIQNSKLLEKIKINANFINDLLEFNNTQVYLANFGNVRCLRCELFYSNNYPEFNGQFVLDIKNINSFYRFFQIPLKYRGIINKIFFTIRFNLDNQNTEIVEIYFDNKSDDFVTEQVIEELNLILSKKNIFNNLNNLRYFINKLFFKIKLA